MSTELVPFDAANHPLMVGETDIAAIMARNLGGEDVAPSDLAMVKMPTGGAIHWSIPTAEGEESQKAITGVIVHIARSRAWWSSKDDTGSPPDCVSGDCSTGHGKPGGECLACPNNQWGTATDDKGQPAKGKACSEKKLLFVIPDGQVLPIVVRVSAASLKATKQWQLGLTSLGKMYSEVIVQLTLRSEKNAAGKKYAEIVIKSVGNLSKEHAAKMLSYAQTMGKVFGDVVKAEASTAAVAPEPQEV